MKEHLNLNTKLIRISVILSSIALLLVWLQPFALQADSPLPPAPPLQDSRFGAVEAYDAPDVANAAGVGWTRVIFWWHQVQPGGINDWNEHYFTDVVLNNEVNSGRELAGIIAGTPPWASETQSVRAVPSGLYLAHDDPDNLWGQFVYRIARRYAGKIDHWIIWNEPDVWDDDHPGKTWDGTVDDYVQLMKVAYQAANAANGEAVLHLAATTYWWDAQYGRDQYFTKLLETINEHPDASAHNSFFDVASLHIYFKPEQVYDVTSLFREELNRHDFEDKPLWINETNAPPSEDPLHPAPGLRFPVTLEEQSYFLIQAWAMGLAADAERLSLYKTRDERSLPIGVEPYGMKRKDGSLRPIFWSYRTVSTYLSKFEEAELHKEEYTRRVVVSRGDLGSTTVVWNMGLGGTEVRIPATASSALLVDPFGPLETIEPSDGSYALTLPPSSGGDIGGKPFMIVEGAGAEIRLERPEGNLEPPTPTPDPDQPPTPAPTPTPVETPVVGPPQAGADEWEIPGGRFFTQTANGEGGFSVIDDPDARFWTEYQRLGGAQTVGYPISRRYSQDGFITQAFQKLILQWRPDANQAWPVNVFDELSKAGFDLQLFQSRQTPLPIDSADYDRPGASWGEIVTRRQDLMNPNPAILARYFAQPDPLTVFGLPTSRVEDVGNHYALRTQRAVFQQWTEDVPWAKAGDVTIANGGTIASELGWLPASALRPEAVGR